MAYLVDFYSVLYNEPIISNKFMNAVRDIRNASAHSNCLINKLFDQLHNNQMRRLKTIGLMIRLVVFIFSEFDMKTWEIKT